MMLRFAKWLVTAFGCGYAPVAPGTVGTLFGAAALYTLHLIYFQHGWLEWYTASVVTGVVLLSITGTYCINILEKEWGKDPSKVVLDEWIGMWITMICIPFNMLNLFIGFVLFRIFDIWKPLGIRKAEAIKGGVGVILDDVLAGILAHLSLRLFINFL